MSRPPLPHSTYTLIEQRGQNDCAIACLAMFLQRDYEEVLVEAARLHRTVWQAGLSCPDMRRIAKRFGVATRWKRNIDYEDDAGVLWVSYHDDNRQHVALLVEGAVIDPVPPIRLWDNVDQYMAYYNAVGNQVLIRIE